MKSVFRLARLADDTSGISWTSGISRPWFIIETMFTSDGPRDRICDGRWSSEDEARAVAEGKLQVRTAQGSTGWGMKRYLLFGTPRYYPAGGMHDFISGHDTIEEAAIAELAWRQREDPTYPECHVFDCETQRIILERNEDDGWREIGK